MRLRLCLGVSFVLAAGPAFAQALPARLEAQMTLPATATVRPPANAPEALRTAGKYAAPDRRRVTAPGAIPDPRGAPGLPVRGQPLQGLSELVVFEGAYWAVSDNGFGARRNSADAMLMLHRLTLDPAAGRLGVAQTIFLSDPRGVFPYPIAMEGAPPARRYLTGADLDPESLQIVRVGRDVRFWIGEEFGPALLEFNAAGHLLAVYEAQSDGRPVRSPDHWAMDLGVVPNVARSKGFEGLALSSDGRMLYALLEGPLLTGADGPGGPEQREGRTVLRLLEFDLEARRWTGRHWLYPLEDPSHAIGAIQVISPEAALVIERDGREGAAAQVKRVYRVRFGGQPSGAVLEKVAHIDLLAIDSAAGPFRFPFVTIESIAALGDGRLAVINDNNFPYSAGRDPARPDDTEVIIVSAPELLRPGP